MDIITVETRDMKVKAKQLRKAGKVPCSVYGGALPEALSIQMDQQAANTLMQNHRDGSQVGLKLNGKVIPTQIKENTRNFANHNVEHLAFQALKADQPVHSVAHILVKNAENVPGVLERILYEVSYSSLPEYMIDTVTIDLEGKPVGTVITVADIPEFNDEHVTVNQEPDSIVLRISDIKRGGAEDAEE